MLSGDTGNSIGHVDPLVFSGDGQVTLGDGSVLTLGDGEVRKSSETSERSGQTSSV